MSDGVPTPTLTWYKPGGSQIDRTTGIQSIVNVKMNVDQDFGGYKCDADNGLNASDFKIVKIDQISRFFSKWCVCADFLVHCQTSLFLAIVRLALNDLVYVHHLINTKVLKSANDLLLIEQLTLALLVLN